MADPGILWKFRTLPDGATIACRTTEQYVSAKKMSEGYEVDYGWCVDALPTDVLDANKYFPLKGAALLAWIGRQITVNTPEDAADLYAAWLACARLRLRPIDGEPIGSVAR